MSAGQPCRTSLHSACGDRPLRQAFATLGPPFAHNLLTTSQQIINRSPQWGEELTSASRPPSQ